MSKDTYLVTDFKELRIELKSAERFNEIEKKSLVSYNMPENIIPQLTIIVISSSLFAGIVDIIPFDSSSQAEIVYSKLIDMYELGKNDGRIECLEQDKELIQGMSLCLKNSHQKE